MRLSVVGLGKLGVCTAACFASKGFDVLGVDINKELVDSINKGIAPVKEPGLQELINKSEGRLKATLDYKEAIENTDITFIIVPTPSLSNGHFSDLYLKNALTQLCKYFKYKSKYHIFVITSTVSPGTIENSLVPLIEEVSQKKLNIHFGIAYNPEFIALGNVINGFLRPDLVLIGESNKTVGDTLEKIYKLTCENNPYIARMSIISAEIAKISINSYVTMKISFANTLANICEKIPAASIDDITKALGADRRISPYYLTGGLAYGGPCFPRDNRAFSAFAKQYGIEAKLAKATDEINNQQITHLVEIVTKQAKSKNKSVSIIGLAYKTNTPVIEESPAIKLLKALLEEDIPVVVYDPLTYENTRGIFGNRIKYASSINDCLNSASVVVIATRDEELIQDIERYKFDKDNKEITIIDCWRMLNQSKFPQNVKCIQLGKYSEDK